MNDIVIHFVLRTLKGERLRSSFYPIAVS